MNVLNQRKRIAIGIFKQLVGCRHSQLSRPFTVNDEPYCLCIQCGARRRFDKYS
jgi:hypothetical protein